MTDPSRWPAPRPVVHSMRPVGSATTRVVELPHHRRRITIDHQPLRGITPEMLLWWFSHLDGEVDHGHERVPRYLAWHPLDHIAWELVAEGAEGGASEGARFRIVEAFQRDPRYFVDVVERVEKLDVTGIRLVQRRAGVRFFQLEHVWSRGDEGTHYVSVMEIGAVHPVLAPLNRYLTTRVMPREMGEAWVRHNVEEVGLLEHLLREPSPPPGTARPPGTPAGR